MDLIPTADEIANKNKELLTDLIKLSFADLKILSEVNSDKNEYIKEEIDFKLFSDSLDEIDKIEIKKFREKLSVFATLIQVAIDRKYNKYLEKIG
jgi:hypothetical protein|tara:strand:+ start:617 stop:901 length:285 start_codon:yes stop_codon:yes gene_type:complete